ncbi:hypothetical protein GQ457_16G013580 [Hibiscus cannabinus]
MSDERWQGMSGFYALCVIPTFNNVFLGIKEADRQMGRMKEMEAINQSLIYMRCKEVVLKTVWLDDNPERFYGCGNYASDESSCKVLLVGLLRKTRANDRKRINERFHVFLQSYGLLY